jgi:Domain of unknown function (DUF4412)
MTHRPWVVAIAAGFAAVSAGVTVQSQQPTEYTVDWVMSGAPMPMTMHVSRDDMKQRIDMDVPSMAPGTMQMYMCTQSTIVRPDLQKVWVLAHVRKQYKEQDFNPKMDATDPRKEAGKVEELGSETIDGEECTKYRLTMEGQGTVLLWNSKKTNMMRKLQPEGGGAGGFTMEAKNVVLGAPPAGTFEIPPGYKEAGGARETATGVFAGLASGIASSFMSNMVGGAAAAAQARAMQQQSKDDAEAMAKICKPMQMPGMRGRGNR